MKNILKSLGLCRRAGKLVAGFDAVCGLLSEEVLDVVVFLTLDASLKTSKEVRYYAAKHGVEVIFLDVTKSEIYEILNKSFAVLAITDIKMANMIKSYLPKTQAELKV